MRKLLSDILPWVRVCQDAVTVRKLHQESYAMKPHTLHVSAYGDLYLFQFHIKFVTLCHL